MFNDHYNSDDNESMPLIPSHDTHPHVQRSTRNVCGNDIGMKIIIWGLLTMVLFGSFYSAFTHISHSSHHDSDGLNIPMYDFNEVHHVLQQQLIDLRSPEGIDGGIGAIHHDYFAYNFNLIDGPNDHTIPTSGAAVIPFYNTIKKIKGGGDRADKDDDTNTDDDQGKGKKTKNKTKKNKKSGKSSKRTSKSGVLDLSMFRMAMASHPSNPFIVDFHRLINDISKAYPNISGRIDFDDVPIFTPVGETPVGEEARSGVEPGPSTVSSSPSLSTPTPPAPPTPTHIPTPSPQPPYSLPSAKHQLPTLGQGQDGKPIENSMNQQDPDTLLSHSDHDVSNIDIDLLHAIRFYHLSDLHVDAFFNPYQSSMQGVCSSCKLSSRIYGDGAYCPLTLPFTRNPMSERRGYAFGRLRCNPPPQLLASALGFLRSHQPFPAFIIITGDIGNHGMPDDSIDITPDTELQDLCPTKFIGMRNTLIMFRQFFPKTPILLTLGNNDHFPKNVVWTPFMNALAALLIEMNMLHPSQAKIFTRIASHYVDLTIDNKAYMRLLQSSSSHRHLFDQHNAQQSGSGSEKGKHDVQHDTSREGTDKSSSSPPSPPPSPPPKEKGKEKDKNTEKLQDEQVDISLRSIKWPKTTEIRVILPDLSLFIPGGEISNVDPSDYEHLDGLQRENVEFPRRAELLSWLNHTLFEAQRDQRYVILAGHQPLALKKSTNELLLQSAHGYVLKAILATYSSIIKLALFGHRNLASIYNILSPDNTPIVPSVVVPGISPRGNNLPALHEVMLRRDDATVLDMEQFVFDIMEENERAQMIVNGITPPSIDDMYKDSGSSVVHQLVASRLGDRYDPNVAKMHFENHQGDNRNGIGGITPSESAKATVSAASTPAAASPSSSPSSPSTKHKQDKKESPSKNTSLSSPYALTREESLKRHGVDCHLDPGLCELLRPWGYIGRWTRHPEIVSSFRHMTGAKELTTHTVSEMNAMIPKSGRLFLSLQVWRAAGIIADQTPENMLCASLYDDETMMKRCLFPEQDDTEGCFARSWLR